MKDRFLIVVEGIADETFIRQYLYHLFGQKVPDNFILRTNGKDNLKSSVAINRMRSMTDQGGINLVIFDADNNFETRRASILEWKKQNGLEFELFLLPNNQDKGELEDLLENIINPNNRPIMDCWEHYEKELVTLDIPGRTPPPLTIPAKKTKIYGYLEALLGSSESEKKKIKERDREYYNSLHWNLNATFLFPLKEFLKKWIS
jgi:hypothetical protein